MLPPCRVIAASELPSPPISRVQGNVNLVWNVLWHLHNAFPDAQHSIPASLLQKRARGATSSGAPTASTYPGTLPTSVTVLPPPAALRASGTPMDALAAPVHSVVTRHVALGCV